MSGNQFIQLMVLNSFLNRNVKFNFSQNSLIIVLHYVVSIVSFSPDFETFRSIQEPSYNVWIHFISIKVYKLYISIYNSGHNSVQYAPGWPAWAGRLDGYGPFLLDPFCDSVIVSVILWGNVPKAVSWN